MGHKVVWSRYKVNWRRRGILTIQKKFLPHAEKTVRKLGSVGKLSH